MRDGYKLDFVLREKEQSEEWKLEKSKRAEARLRRRIATRVAQTAETNRATPTRRPLLSDKERAEMKRRLRALHLLRAFVRGRPYWVVEQSLKPQTWPPHRVVLQSLDLNAVFGKRWILDDFLAWTTNEKPAELAAA